MVLNSRLNNIFLLDFRYNVDPNLKGIDKFEGLCRTVLIENCRRFSFKPAYGIFLGTGEQLNNIITSKLYTEDLNNIHTIIIDKSVKFQRSKLSIIDNIKLTKTIDKADCVVCNNDKYYTCRQFQNHNDFIVLYSKELDQYIISNFDTGDMRLDNKLFFEDFVRKNSTQGSLEERIIEVLKIYNILHPSYEVIYRGNIVALPTRPQADSVYNIINNYNKIIFVDSLYKLINNNFSPLTEEAFNSLESMMRSQDLDTRDLAVRALNGYSLEYCCTMGYLLFRNWSMIQYCKATHSAPFKSILSYLDVTTKELQYGINCLNKLYKVSRNEEDKLFIRNHLKGNITQLIANSIKRYEQLYSDFKFNINFSVE